MNHLALRLRDRPGALALGCHVLEVLAPEEKSLPVRPAPAEEKALRNRADPMDRSQEQIEQPQRPGEKRQRTVGKAPEQRLREQFETEEIHWQVNRQRNKIPAPAPRGDKQPRADHEREDVREIRNDENGDQHAVRIRQQPLQRHRRTLLLLGAMREAHTIHGKNPGLDAAEDKRHQQAEGNDQQRRNHALSAFPLASRASITSSTRLRETRRTLTCSSPMRNS